MHVHVHGRTNYTIIAAQPLTFDPHRCAVLDVE
jgi:hypothetical protein